MYVIYDFIKKNVLKQKVLPRFIMDGYNSFYKTNVSGPNRLKHICDKFQVLKAVLMGMIYTNIFDTLDIATYKSSVKLHVFIHVCQ